MKLFKNHALIVLAVLSGVVAGCNRSIFNELDDISKTVLRTEKGVFRGVNPGMPQVKVKQVEDATLTQGDAEFLYYTLELGNSSRYVDIYYFFNAAGELDKINADIYLDDRNEARVVFENLKRFYDHKFRHGKKTGNAEDREINWEVDWNDDFTGTLESRLSIEDTGENKSIISLSFTFFEKH